VENSRKNIISPKEHPDISKHVLTQPLKYDAEVIMNKSEAGKKGAIEVKRKYGIERCPTCGQLILTDFYKRNGSKGGQMAAMLYKRDREYYSRIGKMGGRGNKKNRDKA
jgi:hypothetical protein